MSTAVAEERTDEAFAHLALFYWDAAELVAGVVPFLLDGLAEGAAVGAALPRPHLELVRDGLGAADARQVRLFDMSEVGRNPGRILAEVLHQVAGSRPSTPARIVGEPIWPGRSELEYPACVQHEALINLSFHGLPATILCPYDAAHLAPAVLADAAATHPQLVEGGAVRPSAAYAPAKAVGRTNRPLPEPDAAATFPFDAARLAAARRFARRQADAVGLDEERVLDLVLAVGELAANSIRHGGGRGVLRLWTEDDLLVAEIHDAGRLDDPLAGRRPASQEQLSGRGLLMVQHLADLVRTFTGPGGTTTRTYWRR
jgi:anti-sigma regulatory factor (Ser/Thr protein kinase)